MLGCDLGWCDQHEPNTAQNLRALALACRPFAGGLATAAILSLLSASVVVSAQPITPPWGPNPCVVGPLRLAHPGACRTPGGMFLPRMGTMTAQEGKPSASSSYSVVYTF